MNRETIPMEDTMTTPTPAPAGGEAERELINSGPWTCFHCGETFIDRACAARHFGADEGKVAACIIKGADHGLLRALRDAEAEADRAIQMVHDETTDAAKAYHAQRCRHTQALISAEEVGYERGLRDGMAEAARPTDDLAVAVEALREAAATLDWAARRMKGNCSGSDVNAVMLAVGRATEVRAALSKLTGGE